HEVLDEVDLAAVDELERGRVDHECHAVALEDRVVLVALVVEAEPVLETRAAAAGDRKAQKRLWHVLLHLELGDPFGRALGQRNAWSGCSAAFRHGPRSVQQWWPQCRCSRPVVKPAAALPAR